MILSDPDMIIPDPDMVIPALGIASVSPGFFSESFKKDSRIIFGIMH